MLIPAKAKYKKAIKGRVKGVCSRGFMLMNGEYGLKALDYARVNSKQIEAARRVISRVLSKSGKIWIRIFPNVPVSKKPVDIRMGKGKGSVEQWIFKVQPGRILFEVSSGIVAGQVAREALQKASAKLPIKCCVIALENK